MMETVMVTATSTITARMMTMARITMAVMEAFLPDRQQST